MTATRNRAQKQSCEWRRRPDHRAFLCAKVGEKYLEYLFTKRRVARRRCARKRKSYRDSCSRVFQLLFGKRGVTISTNNLCLLSDRSVFRVLSLVHRLSFGGSLVDYSFTERRDLLWKQTAFREYVNVLLSRCCSFPSSLFNYATVPMFVKRDARFVEIPVLLAIFIVQWCNRGRTGLS